MNQTRTIVLYGASLSITAIGTGLANKLGWQVIPMDSVSPSATERLCQLNPDVLLFDLAAAQPDTVISLLTKLPNLQLIGVDLANHQALMLSSEKPTLFTTDDFVRLIDAQSLRSQTASSGGSR